MLGASLLYVLGQGIPAVEGALFGIKAAVLVIVFEALLRIGRRALKTRLLLGLAALAFIGIFFLDLPFPLLVAAAAAIGFFTTQRQGVSPARPVPGRWRQAALATVSGLGLWLVPTALVILAVGTGHVLFDIAGFFSKLAVVSFGGRMRFLPTWHSRRSKTTTG